MVLGRYRHYVTIEAPTEVGDGQGGWSVTWAFASYEWMRAMPLSGSRTLEGGGVKFHKSVEFLANKYSAAYTITTSNRILWEGEYYTIHSITPSEKLDEIKILAYV